jgi:hypothetical protein
MNIHQPLTRATNIKINIVAYDEEGNEFQLLMHTHKDFNSIDNVFLNYISPAEQGEIIFEVVQKSLEEDFQIKKILELELAEEWDVLDGESEGDYDYTINAEVELNPAFEGQLGDLYATWLTKEIEKEEDEDAD